MGRSTYSISEKPFASVESIIPSKDLSTVRFPSSTERVSIDGKFFKNPSGRFYVRGVTYGPFGNNHRDEPFPSIERVKSDFDLMRAASINSFRTYHVPPKWLLETAFEKQLSVLVDIPWEKHVCFLDSPRVQAEARKAVHHAVVACREFPSLFAYSIGNEIPTNIVRWHGAKRVERFLAELVDTVKQADPEALATYANYPSTEYLDLSLCDFVTFNVYLHDRDVFQRYLHRLQINVGDKPLMLGELGMDTLRHGGSEQATFLEGHLREAMLLGLAGAFVFSWSDDWVTGGHPIEDWAFGITDRNRIPKESYHSISKVFAASTSKLLREQPTVSVVVCTFNGGATLDQCLDSLLKLDYPKTEVIVVDDGSTDNTAEVLQKYEPSPFQIIRQENRGLGAARNVGLYNASGAIVAYIDSDCFVDQDWLSLLVAQFERCDAAAVGGPNLSPEDGWLAACVGASPGQPTHVLVSDHVAEHIPGCNMAFRRDALLAINGFDDRYWKAGDDVDICWRLENDGKWISFAPGAFVWHHRRQTPMAYLRQQAGYGEAEALLRFQHPNRFNERGDGKWNGVIYGNSLSGIRLESPIIYRGKFGTGLFQCVYQPQSTHWAMLPTSLEWHFVILGILLIVPVWSSASYVALFLWSLSLLVAVLQATQAKLPKKHDGFYSRLLVATLCYVQPLFRSWYRRRTRLFSYSQPSRGRLRNSESDGRACLTNGTTDYWVQEGTVDRMKLLDSLIASFEEQSCRTNVDSGWDCWDLEVYCHRWIMVRIATAQEEHGQGKRLVRIRYRTVPSEICRVFSITSLLCGVFAILFWSLQFAVIALLFAGANLLMYWRGSRQAAWATSQIDATSKKLGMVRCEHEK